MLRRVAIRAANLLTDDRYFFRWLAGLFLLFVAVAAAGWYRIGMF